MGGRYEIFSPTHKELELLNYDALQEYIDQNKINIVVHAAIHVPMFNGVKNEFYNDMKMFLNLEKLSSKLDKLLYFGSGAEYDKRFDINDVKEEDIATSIPTSEYGLAKYTMNKIARQSNNIYNLRLFGIFGKYELWDIKFLSNLCCKAVFDIPLSIRQDCIFDFLFIDDLAPIVEKFIEETPRYHDYNVCLGKSYKLSELAKIVLNVSRKNLQVHLLNPNPNLNYYGCNERLLNEWTDLQLTNIESAIEKLYNYYDENRHLIDVAKL